MAATRVSADAGLRNLGLMTELRSVKGDITKLYAGAIVNAANSRLVPGGGVDGAIHSAGGPEIEKEARAIRERDGELPTGKAVATTAGKLMAEHVIHTVGPVWGDVEPDEAVRLLADCYRNSLDLAKQLDCDTIAFPNISTGVYGFPKKLAAETAVETVREWVEDNPDALEAVVFVSFDAENRKIYKQLLG